ncbi:UNVERIFIED_CONTAM: hypothetical protein K2H54_059041 [Gekko kuhli]
MPQGCCAHPIEDHDKPPMDINSQSQLLIAHPIEDHDKPPMDINSQSQLLIAHPIEDHDKPPMDINSQSQLLIAHPIEDHDKPPMDINNSRQQYIFQLLILFLIPGIVMMIAYGLISLELYRGIKFDVSQRKSSRERKSSTSSNRDEDGDGCYLQKSKKKKVPLQPLTANLSSSKIDRPRSSTSTANLLAKKLVIRMLIVIVILFFICWTPVFSVNTWRAFDPWSATLLLTGAPISFIHLLSYTSACVNPIIYCFMNKRFRMGFLATFTCCAKRKLPVARADMAEEEEGKTTGASLSRYSYTHVNASAPPLTPSAEETERFRSRGPLDLSNVVLYGNTSAN